MKTQEKNRNSEEEKKKNEDDEIKYEQNSQVNERPSQVSSKAVTSETVGSIFKADELTNKQLPWYKRLAYNFDIFSFLPVPTTKPVSTKCSLFASLTFLALLLGFGLYTFIVFLTNNTPKPSQYFVSLKDDKYEAPQFAVGFFWGDSVLEPFDLSDGEYFKLKLIQETRSQQQRRDGEDIPMKMGKDCDFSWLGGSIDTKYLMCPDYANIKPQPGNDGKQVIIQGNAGFSSYMYPQIRIQYCDDPLKQSKNPKCKTQNDLKKITSGGRVQVYLKKSEQKNYSTGKKINYSLDYTMYYYFLVPGDYIRYSVVYQIQQITQKPNMFTSFSDKVTGTYGIKDQIFYPSQQYYDPTRAFSLQLTLDPNILYITYTYDTIVIVGSMLGAFCSVVFSAFAIVFIRFNSNAFYKKHYEWDHIENTVNKIKCLDQENNIVYDYRNPQQSHSDDHGNITRENQANSTIEMKQSLTESEQQLK